MEKECNQCRIKYITKNKKQKYCSVECQHNSYRKKTAERTQIKCELCGVEFEVRKQKLVKYGVKYCSKKCSDSHKKITYLNEGNPTFGKKQTDTWKKNMSQKMKKKWKNKEYVESVKIGRDRFFVENGYYPGTDEKSKEKRKKTMIDKYGVKHNWNGKYGERDCDKTTLNLYGKTSTEMLIDYQHYYGKKTDIEIVFEKLLEELEIPYQIKFRIYDTKKINFWFREYDFLLSNSNILIEVDGDFWHGNEEVFGELNEYQKNTQINDKIKEDFAKLNGYDVIRFWGSEIKNNTIEIKNKIKNLWEKLK